MHGKFELLKKSIEIFLVLCLKAIDQLLWFQVGYFRLHTQFSAPLPVNLTAIYWLEFSGLMSLSKTGKITRSYNV